MTTAEERREEGKIVGWTLRLGAYGSLAIIAVGAVLLAAHVPGGEHVLRAGFLLLMFTPALRILVAGTVFLHEKDYRYALVSLIVLAIVTLTSTLSLMGILPRLER